MKVASFGGFLSLRFLVLVTWCMQGTVMHAVKEIKGTQRIRRAAVQFYVSIQCHQPDVIVLKAYGDYGCYCGVGGSGTPLDATDRCCKTHDDCYRPLKNTIPMSYTETSIMYTCGEICISYENTCNNGIVTCSENNSPLRRALCECDKAAAACFNDAASTYDSGIANVDPSVFCTADANVAALLSELREMPQNSENTTISILSTESQTTRRTTLTPSETTSTPTTPTETSTRYDSISVGHATVTSGFPQSRKFVNRSSAVETNARYNVTDVTAFTAESGEHGTELVDVSTSGNIFLRNSIVKHVWVFIIVKLCTFA